MAENTLIGGDEMTQAYQACISSKDPEIKREACALYKQLSEVQKTQENKEPIPFAEGGEVEEEFQQEEMNDTFSLFDEPVGDDIEEEDSLMEEEGETLGLLERAINVLDEEQYSKLEEAVEMHPELPMIVDTIIMSIEEFDEDGMVEGPGDGTSDSIPAKLSDGEFVMTAKAVKQIGVDKLMKMMKKAEEAYDDQEFDSEDMAFAEGGFVSKPMGESVVMNLTKGENAYFKEVFGSKYDLEELRQAAPSARYKDGKIRVDKKDINGLQKYVDETSRLERGAAPPRFRSDKFMKEAASGTGRATARPASGSLGGGGMRLPKTPGARKDPLNLFN